MADDLRPDERAWIDRYAEATGPDEQTRARMLRRVREEVHRPRPARSRTLAWGLLGAAVAAALLLLVSRSFVLSSRQTARPELLEHDRAGSGAEGRITTPVPRAVEHTSSPARRDRPADTVDTRDAAPPSTPEPLHRSRTRETPSASAAAEEAALRARLEEETALLESVQRALRRDDPSTALELLADHPRRFPQGALRQEAAGLRAVALCKRGQSRQGRAEAKLFLRAHPSSPLAERVRTACTLAPDTSP
jgi:cytoskeletal protein RodZ